MTEWSAPCDVCGKPAVGVFSSFVPISLCYCQECLDTGREPYWICICRLQGLGRATRADIADGYRETIDVSLAFAGKTWDELFADVRKADADHGSR